MQSRGLTEDVWRLNIVEASPHGATCRGRVCVGCCLIVSTHVKDALTDLSFLLPVCVSLFRPVSIGQLPKLAEDWLFRTAAIFSSLLFFSPSVGQTVARDLINRRVKAVTWGHSWCVCWLCVCVCVWNPIRTCFLYSPPATLAELTQWCVTREFVAGRLLLCYSNKHNLVSRQHENHRKRH